MKSKEDWVEERSGLLGGLREIFEVLFEGVGLDEDEI
jgi:hypothetical protein